MSRWLYPFERQALWQRRRRLAIVLLVGFVVLSLLDRSLYHWLFAGAGLELDAIDAVRRSQEGKDAVAALRTAGYLPAWIAVGAALLIAARPWRREGLKGDGARRAWGGLLVILSAALAGGVADAIKPVIGRVRPMFSDGRHLFWRVEGIPDDRISYGMASSHAAVAFGAAFAILFLYGRPGWVALAIAAGCGVTRMMSGAHFATDVYVAAVLGYAFARLLVPREQEGLLLP